MKNATKDYADPSVQAEIEQELSLDYIYMDRQFFINLLPYLKIPGIILLHAAFRSNPKTGDVDAFDMEEIAELYGIHFGSVARAVKELKDAGRFIQ